MERIHGVKKLSVIIPVRNRAELLRHCLASVEVQSWRPMQVIVVNDGSTDASASVAIAWGNRMAAADFEVEVLNTPDCGAAAARLAGVTKANGDILAFFDSDDTMRPDYARSIMEVFTLQPDCEIVYWRRHLRKSGSHTRLFRPGFGFLRHSLSMASHVVHCRLATQACAVSRELYERSGGWNASLPRWNDWELGIRYLASLQGRSAGINRVLVDVLVHSDSITGNSFRSGAGLLEKSLNAALAFASTMSESPRQRLTRLIAYKMASLGALYAREGDTCLGHRTLASAMTLIPDRFGRFVLKSAFRYTRLGLRGAALWAIPLIVKGGSLN